MEFDDEFKTGNVECYPSEDPLEKRLYNFKSLRIKS